MTHLSVISQAYPSSVAYLLDAPEIVTAENNKRYLQMPEVPEGYRLTYLGADYEQVVGADCEVNLRAAQ